MALLNSECYCTNFDNITQNTRLEGSQSFIEEAKNWEIDDRSNCRCFGPTFHVFIHFLFLSNVNVNFALIMDLHLIATSVK